MIFMTREQMRAYDTVAMERYGVPGCVLMENAGRGATRVVEDVARDRTGRVVIVCGKGNNGGDGFVIARHLLNSGRDVRVVLLGLVGDLRGDAKLNADILVAMGGSMTEIPDDDLSALPGLLAHSACIVDAIFGTGLERAVRGRHASVIEAINGSRPPVVAVDLPSGLDADTGRALGTAIEADATATFAHLKRGLVIHPGVEHAGEITVVDIGAPSSAASEAGWDGVLLDTDEVAGLLVPRNPDTHKGTYGHVLVVAGSPGKTGAASLAGLAALRSGAGLVTLAVPLEVMPAMEAAKPPEVMLEPLLESLLDDVTDRNLARLESLVEGKSAVAFGPGCGLTDAMGKLLAATLEKVSVPVVLDADGLTLLSRMPPEILEAREAATVLTPHPGEMARLAGAATAEIQASRIPTARAHAERLRSHVVLKGARTVIASPRGDVAVNPTGNAGMASAGSGDVLTGVIASLLAQGHDPHEASCLGAWLHGLAGDRVAGSSGLRGMVAGDIVEHLPDAIAETESLRSPPTH